MKILPQTILIILLFLLGISNNTSAQTTVANGNWSSPTTWGGPPPMGTGTVVINHTVTLDMDYSHSSGSITINASGALNGNSAMRVFALNYPSGTAILTIDGTLNVARIPLAFSIVTNNGTIQSDSLLNSATIDNNSGASINAAQFMNNTGGTINNNGTIISTNFLNVDTVSNTGTLTTNDFCNSKTFTNSASGNINVSYDFSNIDTLASPAIFTNDGYVGVQNDWHNGNQINGSGKFCIGNNSWNEGSMTGTFDFCDQSGGNVDLNTGTVAGTITNCLYTCSVNIDELAKDMVINTYPNPFSSQTTLQLNNYVKDATVTISNVYGQTVRKINNISGQTVVLYRENLPNGLYYIWLTESNKTIATRKLVITE